MIRKLVCALGVLLLALTTVSIAWGKGHVPIDRLQICTDKGRVKNISAKKLAKELAKGACRLPACDFDNVSLAGDTCDNTDDGDGFCDDPGSPPAIPSDSAVGVTLACTNPF